MMDSSNAVAYSDVPEEFRRISQHVVRYRKVNDHFYAHMGDYEAIGHSISGVHANLTEQYKKTEN